MAKIVTLKNSSDEEVYPITVAEAVNGGLYADNGIEVTGVIPDVTTSRIVDEAVTSGKIDWASFSATFCNWVHLNAVRTITTNTLTNKMQITLPKAGKYAIFYNMNTYNQDGGFNGEVNTRLLCGSSTSGTLTTFIAPVNWASTSNSDVATFTTTSDNEIVYLQASVNWPTRGTCYISALSYLAYLRIG